MEFFTHNLLQNLLVLHQGIAMSSSNGWSLTLASGGKPVFFPSASTSSSVFSADGRYNIVILSHQIRIYFISTRQCTRTIDLDCTKVVDAKLDVKDDGHLLLFTSTGVIITVLWKEKVDEPIISHDSIDLPLLSVVGINEKSFYVMTGESKTKTLYKINRHNILSHQLLQLENVSLYSISSNCHNVVFLTSNHQLHLYNLSVCYGRDEEEIEESSEYSGLIQQIESTKETINFPYKSPIISMAISNDLTIALGSSLGAIQILYGGLTNSKPQRLLKWHVDQVKSLNFTPDSSYLLSGGLEKVLVFWHLETDKTQFLPRLNGLIEKISIDTNKPDYYNLILKNTSSDNSSYEILILSAVDLVSRLSVNAIKPNFQHSLPQTIAKAKKKLAKNKDNFDFFKLKHDYSAKFEIHPLTKHLYFPNNSTIQSYDPIKNEQNFIQNIAPTLSTGKVRSELKLTDPIISLLAFTNDGQWMCTFDSMATSDIDNLLSKDDKQYALKFWKFIESNDANGRDSAMVTNSINNTVGYWDLSTKIIDPHGNSNPVLSIIPSPSTYHSGLAFLTADNKGGLRVWRPRIPKEIYQTMKNNNTKKLQQTAWTLRKSKPSGALSSDSVDVCWSDDGSIIILGHESSISTISADTFEEVSHDFFKVPSLSGSKIRSLSLIDTDLVVLSKTRIVSYNLLSGELNNLVAKVNTTSGGKNMIAVDSKNKLICLAVNYYSNEDENLCIKSKIMIFKPDELKPVHIMNHDQGISSIRHSNSSFMFIDLDSRIGYITPPASSLIDNIIEEDITNDMNKMLLKAQATADIISYRSAPVSHRAANGTADAIDDNSEVTKTLDINSFLPIFENIEGVQIGTLFDRIVKVIQ